MFEITPVPAWSGNLLWLGGVALAGFLVAWALTDVLHMRRSVYVGVLGLLAGGLAAWYTLWASAGGELWTNRWVWGIVGGIVAGFLLDMLVSRALRPETGAPVSSARFAWESGVYGVAEGLLLSVLPVVITWQIFAAVQWTSGWRAIVAAVAVFVASVAVIAIHHLGYAEFRSRKMAQAILGCGVLTVATLATGSPLSAAVGHVLLHAGLLRQGQVLPPNERWRRGGGPRRLVAT